MGSQPQSQDLEHQPPPVQDDMRIRREPRRESSEPKQQAVNEAAQPRSHPRRLRTAGEPASARWVDCCRFEVVLSPAAGAGRRQQACPLPQGS
jgi:hypothetical protein